MQHVEQNGAKWRYMEGVQLHVYLFVDKSTVITLLSIVIILYDIK